MTDLPGEPAISSAEPETQRPGVPLWRVGKPDAFLAAAVSVARTALQEIAAPEDIGAHVGARSEGIRCVTHLFECKKPGYHGWVWFATLARVARARDSTVNEVGMLPTNDSVLAPAWVPWSDRVRPEDREHEDQPAVAAGPALADPDSETETEPDAETETDAEVASDETAVGDTMGSSDAPSELQ